MKETIAKWIYGNARPLEKARYAYHFEKGDRERVIDALMTFRNADGGFGNALEPDFRVPDSTPVATWMASRIMEEIGLKSDHSLIKSTVGYLKRTPEKENWRYFFRIPAINDHPHAPWWHYTLGNAIEGYNPTASLLGFLHKHMPKDDPHRGSLEDAVEEAVKHFIDHDIEEMHELRCFNELHAYLRGTRQNDAFRKKLSQRNLDVVEHDREKWFTTYCARPSQLFLTDKTPGADQVQALIVEELEMMRKHRSEEGVFDITWSWGCYEETFKRAKREWMGILALETLLRHKTFNVPIEP